MIWLPGSRAGVHEAAAGSTCCGWETPLGLRLHKLTEWRSRELLDEAVKAQGQMRS